MKKYDFSPLGNIKIATVGVHFWLGAATIGLTFVSMAVLGDGDYYWIPTLMGVVLLLYSIVQFFMTVKKIDEANTQAFQQFASTNDLTFLPEEKFTGEKGSLFAEGHSQRVRNILSGQSQGLPFKLFNFEYTIGHGKYSHSHRLSVLSVTLPHNMPQLVIDSLVEAGSGRSSTLPITFDDSQKIHLEGDFSQFFDVYAPKNHGIDALTILAPDVMRTLLQQEAVCDIEIIEDRIYFYWPLYPERREHYEKILTVFETIMAQIAPPILRMEDAVAAQKTMETTATPTSLLRAESPLKALIPIILSVILYATTSFVVEEWAAEGDASDLMKLVPIFVWGLFLLGSLYFWYRPSASQSLAAALWQRALGLEFS